MPGSRGLRVAELPVFRGLVDGLPENLKGLVLTADLQGRMLLPDTEGRLPLLGVALIAELKKLAQKKVIPNLEEMGALLAGDLFTAEELDQRGTSGDVFPVWEAFAQSHRWVCGILGNHDFLEEGDIGRLPGQAHLLDGGHVDLNGLRIAGVSGICGKPGRPNRKSREQFAQLFDACLKYAPDFTLVHAPPKGHEPDLIGCETTAEVLAGHKDRVVVCGHAHWPAIDQAFPEGNLVLNVDGRVLVLTT
jgi:Icc-related predicted phosphoesterase